MVVLVAVGAEVDEDRNLFRTVNIQVDCFRLIGTGIIFVPSGLVVGLDSQVYLPGRPDSLGNGDGCPESAVRFGQLIVDLGSTVQR